MTSCIEQDGDPKPTDEVTLISPDNDQNPYDYIGKQHNDGVQALIDNHDDEINATLAMDPIEGEKLIFKLTGLEMRCYKKLRGEFGLGSEERIEDLPIFDLEKLLRTPPFNPHEMSALQSIFDEVSLLAHSTNDDLNTIIMRIKTIEEKYLQDEGIENDEAFFGALSTMRFSSHLWGRNPSTRKRGGRGWWKVVLSDCIGFGVGTFLDGPATGIDLGVGMSRVVAGTLK
jgi:hypothetical protein